MLGGSSAAHSELEAPRSDSLGEGAEPLPPAETAGPNCQDGHRSRPERVPKGHNLRITSSAAAELCRQAAVAGTPGMMHIDLLPGGCEAWSIRLRPGHLAGTPIARADGVTLHAPAEQVGLLTGLLLDYKGDLGGGGFLVRSGQGTRHCACGAAFSRESEPGTTGQ